MMFDHTGFRSLWPVMLLLPWFFVGLAYLLTAVLRAKQSEGRRTAAGAHHFPMHIPRSGWHQSRAVHSAASSALHEPSGEETVTAGHVTAGVARPPVRDLDRSARGSGMTASRKAA